MDDHRPAAAGRRFSPWRLWPLAVMAAGIAAFFALGWDQYMSFEALGDHRQTLLAWADEYRLLSVLAYIGIYGVVVALSIPGAVYMTIAGGFVFGAFETTLYVVVGATLGAIAVFLAARHALGDFFRAKAGPAVRRMEAGFRANALSYLLVLRLMPVFPFWLVNLVPAFLGVPLRIFALGTFIGIIPGTFVSALVGNGLGAVFDAGEAPDLGIIFKPAILGPIIGLAVLSLIPVVYKRFKRDKT